MHHFPFRYVDKTKVYPIIDINTSTQNVQLKGVISNIRLFGEGRVRRLLATLRDETGAIELIWFRGWGYMKQYLKEGHSYLVFGKPNYYNGKFSIPHPEMEIVEQQGELQLASRLEAVYHTSEKLKGSKLDSRGIHRLMKTLFDKLLPEHIFENLPISVLHGQFLNESLADEQADDVEAVMMDFLDTPTPELLAPSSNGNGKANQDMFPDDCMNLPLLSRYAAFKNIHVPENEAMIQRAKERLKFEELFFIQLRVQQIKMNRYRKFQGFRFESIADYFHKFYHEKLPFELTGAQKRVLKEIRRDTLSGKQMNRLLQGDVGSGKTIIGLMTMLMALDNGFQACMMAPTEILAQQHYQKISKMVEGLDVSVELLTGSVKGRKRKSLLDKLELGVTDILIGTHALIEDTVVFKNLGMAIVDEQHRFGVAQRAKLWEKNEKPPHVLVMTATPIPRTLAMTVYGDLEVSVIDELPPGRKPIITAHRKDNSRLRVFEFMRTEIEKGRQIYVVYPLINESEVLNYKDLMDGYESIVRAFPTPDYQVGVLHGQMHNVDKDEEMARFKDGETQILVATTVVEVGVDVPNASLMVIESAERFGLAQLHQLRGRVGRGGEQSYCILMTGQKLSKEGVIRMQTMVQTNDGFKIAEVDMQLRGPGDMEGTQQSGVLNLRLASLIEDSELLNIARQAAGFVVKHDPTLTHSENGSLRYYLEYVASESRNKWSRIS